MTGAMTMDRMGTMMPGMPGATGPMMPGMMAPSSWLMVPRCTMKMEKCDGGMKMTCTCPDQTSCTMMQNLCLMSASLGLSTVPLGGALEPEIARGVDLPATDAVLYVALCGASK